ncbi:hypothetical protein CVT25_007680 [Psilocybe cyanescens]|uniref:Uncharacterized protein n=1 Tax=Psilocybe cyanescens TaxID=93625 RepID=A0A409XVI1_PSICY|nr:hypothetical protein CVT25_007680 [Psilocybe cyanescens]
MSTAKGTAVFLDEIEFIKEAGNAIQERMMTNEEKYKAMVDPEKTVLEVGITHAKTHDMEVRWLSSLSSNSFRHANIRQFILARFGIYTFNWIRVQFFDGDTGPTSDMHSDSHPYPAKASLSSPSSLFSFPFLSSYTRAHGIAFLLATYPDVVKTSMRTQKPSGIMTLAFRLAHAISSA